MVRISTGRIRKGSIYHQVDLRDEGDGDNFTQNKNKSNDIKKEFESDNGKECNENEPDDVHNDIDKKKRTAIIDTQTIGKKRPPQAGTSNKFKRRFPRYKRISRSLRWTKANDKEREKHQSLTTHVEQHYFGPKKYIDPSHYPLEQITDAEYGISQSYAPVENSEVEYPIGDLRNMDKDTDEKRFKRQERCKYIAATSTSIVCLVVVVIIGIISSDVTKSIKLEIICSEANVATTSGHKKCSDACIDGECCFSTGNESCYKGSEEKCAQYTWCGILHPQVDGDTDIVDNIVAPAQNDIGSICSDYSISTTSGYDACLSACNKGQCCFVQTGFELNIESPPSNVHSCKESHFLVCESYDPCLSLGGIENKYRASQDLVNTVCTPNNIQKTQGRRECENACQPRNCCFTLNRKANCNADNREWCNIFKACEVLLDSYSTDNNIENEQEITVDDPSYSNSVDTDGESGNFGLEQEDVDDFTTQNKTGSSEDIDSSDDFGAIMPPETLSQGHSPSHIDIVCSDPKRNNVCYALCYDYLCCLDENFETASTSCHSKTICDTYRSCSKFVEENTIADTPIENISNDTSNGSTSSIPNDVTASPGKVSPIDFESACESNNIQTEVGKANCQTACQRWSCCWNPNDNERCAMFECILAIKMCDIGIDVVTSEINCPQLSCCEDPDESNRCDSYECVKAIKVCNVELAMEDPNQ